MLTKCPLQARGIRNAGVPTKGRLTYFQDQELKLELQFKKEGEWTDCFSTVGAKVPSVAYLGFSSHTGDLSDHHDIISIDTRNLYNTNPSTSGSRSGSSSSTSSKSQKSSKSSSGGSWLWFFVKVLLFIGVLVGYKKGPGGRR